MPSEKAHTWATLAVAATLLPLSPEASAGALLGLAVDPDLDQAKAGGRYRMKLASRPLGRLWTWAWEPYDLLAKHRGPSHWPIVGTGGRAAYALGGFWPALYAAPMERWRRASLVPVGVVLTVASWTFVIGWVYATGWAGLAKLGAGLALADLVHEGMDWWKKWKS